VLWAGKGFGKQTKTAVIMGATVIVFVQLLHISLLHVRKPAVYVHYLYAQSLKELAEEEDSKVAHNRVM